MAYSAIAAARKVTTTRAAVPARWAVRFREFIGIAIEREDTSASARSSDHDAAADHLNDPLVVQPFIRRVALRLESDDSSGRRLEHDASDVAGEHTRFVLLQQLLVLDESAKVGVGSQSCRLPGFVRFCSAENTVSAWDAKPMAVLLVGLEPHLIERLVVR